MLLDFFRAFGSEKLWAFEFWVLGFGLEGVRCRSFGFSGLGLWGFGALVAVGTIRLMQGSLELD